MNWIELLTVTFSLLFIESIKFSIIKDQSNCLIQLVKVVEYYSILLKID